MDPRLIRLPSIFLILLRPSSTRPLPENSAAFRVPLSLSKPAIANYLEQVYAVKVVNVQTAIMTGKSKRDRDGRLYRRSDWKKAIVRISSSPPWSYPTADRIAQLSGKAP